MRNVKIITDSCSDLSPDLIEKYGIDFAKMNTVYEGQTTPADLYWTKEEAHALYNIMREGGRVTTTQVPPEEFTRVFTEYLEKDYDIVYIACSSKQSGSVNTGAVVAKKLLENYPGAEIYCIDSLNASMGEGLLAIRAAGLVDEGLSAGEIAEIINSERNLVNEYVTVHSLDALKRAGRVKATAAFLGNLMGVKPIIISDAKGDQVSYKKAKGRLNSFKEVAALLKESIVDPEDQIIYVTHADCSEEEVNTLKEILKNEIPCKDVHTGIMGPIIGASIGPDAVGIFAFGKEITYVAEA